MESRFTQAKSFLSFSLCFYKVTSTLIIHNWTAQEEHISDQITHARNIHAAAIYVRGTYLWNDLDNDDHSCDAQIVSKSLFKKLHPNVVNVPWNPSMVLFFLIFITEHIQGTILIFQCYRFFFINCFNE